MRVLPEVTVDAMHPAVEVNVVQVHSLLEFVRIACGHEVVLGIEQVSFAVAFEDFAKHPTMAMKVAELRVLEIFVKAPDTCVPEKVRIRPESAQT